MGVKKIIFVIVGCVCLALGFFLMVRKGIWVPCVILAVVWLAHMVYFLFFVKTIKE